MMTRERELLQQALDALDRAISDDRAYIRECKDAAEAIRAHLAAQPAPVVPIDMVLHCPACGLQHIDAPDERTPDWKNEPHRSHLCHGCGHIWRPADVPTNGVAAVATKGKADSPIAAPVVREMQDDLIESVIRDVAELDYSSPEGMPDVMLVTANELRGILQAHGITGGSNAT